MIGSRNLLTGRSPQRSSKQFLFSIAIGSGTEKEAPKCALRFGASIGSAFRNPTLETSEGLSLTQNWWLWQKLTCTLPPSPSQSSFGWCTSEWVGTQPRSPGWPTGPAGRRTPGYWRSLGYNLEGNNNTTSSQASTTSHSHFGFTLFRHVGFWGGLAWRGACYLIIIIIIIIITLFI